MSARKDIYFRKQVYECGFRFFNNIIFENFHGKRPHPGGDDVCQHCELFDAAGALAGGAKGHRGRNIYLNLRRFLRFRTPAFDGD